MGMTIEHDPTEIAGTINHGDRAHSSVVGGSSAKRVINCPGSVKALLDFPEQPTSPAAERGTALHEAMEWWLDQPAGTNIAGALRKTFNGREITPADLADALLPAAAAFEHFEDLCQHEGGLDLIVEGRVEIKGVPGAHGFADIIGRTKRRSVVWDWKMGNHPVPAYENAQGMFYALGALHTFPDMFEQDDDWPVEIIICQPAIHADTPEGYDRWTTTVGRLRAFRDELARAVSEAQSDDPSRKRGDWCDFQPCRATCPLHLAPLSGLSALAAGLAKVEATNEVPVEQRSEADEDFLAAFYGDAMELKDRLTPLLNEWEAQAHARLEAGLPVYGKKLVPKRAMRLAFADEKKAVSLLRKIGLKDKNVLYTQKLISPAQAEKEIKAAKLPMTEKQAADFKALSPSTSSGSTMADWDDPRPVYKDIGARVSELANKLAGN